MQIEKIRVVEKIKNIETKVHPSLRVFFGYNLYKSGILYKSLVEENHYQQFGLSTQECGILYILSTDDRVNQLNLGHEMGIDKATIVKNIDNLEHLKLVKRIVDPDDRRANLLLITTKGRTLVEKIRSARNEVENRVFSQFTKEDQQHLRRLLPKLLETLMSQR